MNGHGHRTVAVLAHLAITPALVAQPPSWTLLGCVAAVATAAGPCSPDCDQQHMVGRLVGGHRKGTHCPEAALVLTLAVLATDVPLAMASPLLVAWWAHIATDAAWGGVPFPTLAGILNLCGLPTSIWHKFGVRFKTGGFLETGRIRIRGQWRRIVPFRPVPALAVALSAYLVVALYGLTPALRAAVETLGA